MDFLPPKPPIYLMKIGKISKLAILEALAWLKSPKIKYSEI